MQNPGSAPSEVATSGPLHSLGHRLARDPRDLGREEEDYFSSAGDDDDGGHGGEGLNVGSASGVLGGVSSVYMSDSGPGHGRQDGPDAGPRGSLSGRMGGRWNAGEGLSVQP